MEATGIYTDEARKTIPDCVEQIQKGRGVIKTVCQFGIPLFFYISGIATTHYDCERKGFKKFIISKFWRLLVPFIVGVFTILIPRLYLT